MITKFPDDKNATDLQIIITLWKLCFFDNILSAWKTFPPHLIMIMMTLMIIMIMMILLVVMTLKILMIKMMMIKT